MNPESKTPTPPTVTNTLPLLTDWDALKEASRLSGGHFFDPETMRAFGSKTAHGDFWTLADGLGCLFITSERDASPCRSTDRLAWGGARRYTVRTATFSPSGLSINDAGPYEGTDHGFGAFGSLGTARTHAKKCTTKGTPERAAMLAFLASRREMNGWPAVDLEA